MCGSVKRVVLAGLVDVFVVLSHRETQHLSHFALEHEHCAGVCGV